MKITLTISNTEHTDRKFYMFYLQAVQRQIEKGKANTNRHRQQKSLKHSINQQCSRLK